MAFLPAEVGPSHQTEKIIKISLSFQSSPTTTLSLLQIGIAIEMDSFQDLLSCLGATVFFSLLVSFVVTKLLTMDSARGRTSMMQKGESFIFDWICEEQQPPHRDQSTVESPLGRVSSDGVLLDEFTTVEMKSEAYDLVELLNPESEEINVGGDDLFVDQVFDENPDRLGFCKVGVESSSGNLMGLDWEGGGGGGDKEKDDEDWEGVERSELEKRFGDAMIFVGSMNNASNINASLDYDDKLQLYALGMIVLEGPYVLPQLVGLKLSSTAKWY